MGVRKGSKNIQGNVQKTTSAVDSGQAAREKEDSVSQTRTRTSFIGSVGTNQPPGALTTINVDSNTDPKKRPTPTRVRGGSGFAKVDFAASRGINADLPITVIADNNQTKVAPHGATPITSTAFLAAKAQFQQREADTQQFIEQSKIRLDIFDDDIDDDLISEFSLNNVISDLSAPTIENPKAFAVSDGDVNIQDNILSKFDNVAYNFRFFMGPEKATAESILNEDIVIISETGSTGFNITEAQINNIIAPTSITRNSFATQINFTIIEPHGNTLFDKLRNAALSLGVQDHKNVPLWFELSFKGYTSGGEESHKGGEFADLSSETRLWRIRVNTVDIEINKGGTVYSFKCIPFNEVAMKDAARRLEKDEHIQARTVGQFFEELAKKLNDYSNFSTITNIDDTFRIKQYAFAFPPKSEVPETRLPAQEWVLRADNETGNIRSEGFIFIGNEDGKSRITFGKGTSIESIIQTILSTTTEGQALATHGIEKNDIQDTGAKTERDAKKDSVIFVVDTTVDIVSYNALARNYNQLIVYHISPYRTYIPMLSRKHIEEAIGKKQKERTDRLLKISRIRKKYEYIFTGLNTEILDYNIKFNAAWFVSLPLFQGQDRAALAGSSVKMNSIKSSKRIVQELNANVRSLTAKKSELDTRLSDLITQVASNEIPSRLGSLIDEIKEERNRLDRELEELALGGPSLRPLLERRGDIQRIQELRSSAFTEINKLADIDFSTRRINTSLFGAESQIKSVSLTSLAQETKNIDFLKGNNIVGFAKNSRAAEFRDRVANRKQATGNGSIFFVEDFDEISTGRDITEEQLKEIFIPGTEIVPSGVVEVNAEGTAGKGRSFFSAIYNQVYGVKGDMITLELEIRGDPYWLGESNENVRVTNSRGGDRNLMGADSTILLTFAGPKSFDDGTFESREDSFAGTGLADINRTQNGFNGVYFIRQVENSFSEGKFTQKLIGQIDPFTQEQTVIEAVIKLSNKLE